MRRSQIFKGLTTILLQAIQRALLLAGASMSPTAWAADCPAAVPFPDGIEIVKAIRVFTAANGESAFEDLSFKGEGKAYFKPGEIFAHTGLGAAKKVQLVSGPANAVMPPHSTPYKEMFLTIQGSSTIVLPGGEERALSPGSLVIFDDAGSKTGHGGRTGACGYVAINIVPDDTTPAPAP